MKPDWAKDLKVGDSVNVKREMFTRGGQAGYIIDEPDDEGVNLDFLCDVFGHRFGVPSIERWLWNELEP